MNTGMEDSDWDLLLRRIRSGKCTPFLGAGASAHVLPTGTALADRWASELNYPLSEHGDLARVAQYIALTQDHLLPKELVADMCKAVDFSAALQSGHCYDVIAELDLPVFITTNYDDLLLHALRLKGKTPKPMVSPWNDHAARLAKQTYTYRPDSQNPAVYFLHGKADDPGTIVVTEDDYLDFIVWVTKNWRLQANRSLVAPAVKEALGDNSLLFIGYSQNDWSFRVLMRSIRQAGMGLGALSVAVQISPLDAGAAEVDQNNVHRYLTEYFSGIQKNRVKVYWGTADAFTKELKARLAET